MTQTAERTHGSVVEGEAATATLCEALAGLTGREGAVLLGAGVVRSLVWDCSTSSRNDNTDLSLSSER